jgi:TatD DNase family protein
MGKTHFDIPALGVPSADSHAHLDMLEDAPAALQRAASAGLAAILTIVYPVDMGELGSIAMIPGWRKEAGERLADDGVDAAVPDVAVAVGIHPHEARHHDATAEELVRGLIADGTAVAIGEMGLDFHYDNSPRDAQRESFRAQLRLAHEAELPAVVHLRESHDEGHDILADEGVPEAGCVIHCFGEDAATAERFVEMGCHVSFAGTVTFKKADRIREAAAVVPMDRLLVETDCPFLAPEPYRGRKNEPALSVFCSVAIGEARGIDPCEVARAAHDNARRLFWRGS